MKILFIGLGSIGTRHAKILQKKYKHQLFALRSSENNKKNKLGIREIYSWKEAEKIKPDLAFITNPTSLHIETALKCAKLGCKLFIEKPIGADLEGLEMLIKMVKKNNLATYVGYNLRFHPVIRELKKYVQKNKPLHARAVCTSFLPNWRPGQNYLKSYSANSKMGGGVIFDLSHEIDYLSFLLGRIKKITGHFSRISRVTKDAEDFADLIIEAEKAPASISLSFMSQLRQRYVQLEFQEMTVIGDIANLEISEYKNEKLNKSYKLDYYQGQEYEAQLKYFFKNLNNPAMMNNLDEGSGLFKKIIAFKKNA